MLRDWKKVNVCVAPFVVNFSGAPNRHWAAIPGSARL